MSDELYYVQAIRKWRYNTRLKRKEYLIKWHGYPEEENTWEPEHYLECDIYLRDFERKLKPQERAYYNSEEPSRLSGFQRNAEFVACVGADGPREQQQQARRGYCNKNLARLDSDDEPDNSSINSNADSEPFYCLIMFNDNDVVEEISIDEFHRHQPEAAFQFLESRLWLRIVRSRSRAGGPK